MSLLDDVSIVVTPNGYKAGELYAVVPVPTEGAEQVINGDFATDSDWTKTAGVSISGGFANFTSGQDNFVFQDIMVIGKRYIMSLNYNITSLTGSAYFGSNGGSGNAILSMAGLSGSGTLSGEITASDTKLIVRSSSFDGTITNVSVKEYTAADMDVTRATAATRVDEAGLVNYAEVVSDTELVSNGDFEIASGDVGGFWTTGAGWAILGNGLATRAATGTNFAVDRDSFLTINQTYKVVIVVQVVTSGNVKVVLGATNSPEFTAAGTYTFIGVQTNNTKLRISPSNDYVGSVSNISVKEVTRDNVPRIDYTGGGCPHILAEPQRTNQITQNNQFDTTWVTSNLGITSGQNGIYNTTDAWLFNATNSLANVTISVSTSGENTYSVYAKAGTEDGVFIRFTGGSNPRAFFNLTNGTLISESGTTNTNVENVGNGWYRCSITGSETITDARIYVADSSGNFVSSGNIYIQYSQLENGSYPTSIIPTSGSTVTRNKDQFTRDGIGSLINSEEGVLFVELSALANDGLSKRITLADGSISNRVSLELDEIANKIKAFISKGGTSQILEYTTPNLLQFNKIAIKWKVNDFAIWFNGNEVATDSSGDVPTGVNELSFNDGQGGNNFFGKVKQLQVYKTALTDEQLIQLTGESGTDFYESYAEMASALTYTIQ